MNVHSVELPLVHQGWFIYKIDGCLSRIKEPFENQISIPIMIGTRHYLNGLLAIQPES